MDIWTVFIIAVGLAMDTFAVSITSGVVIRELKVYHGLKLGLFFGFFQSVMLIFGELLGSGMKGFISSIDHWIAFSLLALIGGKMVYESFRLEDEVKTNPLELPVLFMLSVATSIDSFAVGLSFAVLNVSILMPMIIIGFVTFAISFAGVFIGNKAGHFFENKIEIFGGLILISIGIKILLEHLGNK